MPTPGVKARIDRFWRAVRRLEAISSAGEERFASDDNLVDAGERNLQVAIEAVIDVGEALIAYMGWRTPKSYRDVSTVLFENGVISGALYEQFKRAVNIRNILVHNYVYVMPKDLYATIKDLIGTLTEIMNSIISYMAERGIDP